jgi:hypothetical protein
MCKVHEFKNVMCSKLAFLNIEMHVTFEDHNFLHADWWPDFSFACAVLGSCAKKYVIETLGSKLLSVWSWAFLSYTMPKMDLNMQSKINQSTCKLHTF